MNVALPAENYISLFAGAGGLDLGLRIALPQARCVCYCENEINAAKILAARMEEGSFDNAPVWSDVRTFPCELFRGRVAGIVGGFPCTDLSVAGKRAGIRGEHSGLWFEHLRIIREVRPRWVFVENVPAVIAFPAGGIVLGGLAELGFDAEWLSIRASDVGASHGRKRVFILAYRKGGGFGISRESSGSGGFVDGSNAELGHPDQPGLEGRRDGGSKRGDEIRAGQAGDALERTSTSAIFAPGPDDPIWQDVLVRDYLLRPALAQAEIEPHLHKLADGMARSLDSGRTDSLRAVGNGVVPLQGAAAFAILAGRAGL